ncbi:MAG: hypothetical protein E7167_01430 [Firmicutes bacterium]|nr:hypothetical protein [Bacillota bacterium]
MTKKMTKKEMFAQLIEKYALTAEERAFCEHEIELLNKKSTGERKPTATQVANEGLKVGILAYMANEPNRLFSISELIKEVPELAGLSTQKVSPLMSALEKAEKVVKIVEKRKSLYKLAE